MHIFAFKIIPLAFFVLFVKISFLFSVDSRTQKIEELVNKCMVSGKIPGLAIIVLDNNKVFYKKGFGYADLKSKSPVTHTTLFELGSTSKAFTAMGILLLESKGLVNLNDPVDKYIPWLKMKYQGQNISPTINQFLHHSSGIPFNSIGDIPVSNENDALEMTIKTLINKELDFIPGTRFQYATINYDVIGLVIQNVSSKLYEQYMTDNILKPLELNNTILYKENNTKLAKGYKIAFNKPFKYEAPFYRGNLPAGYYITNIDDLSKWIGFQLGVIKFENKFDEIIKKTHTSDSISSYCYGWFFNESSRTFEHGGTNPNFSSQICINYQNNIGIGILANINTSYTKALSDGIMNIMSDLPVSKLDVEDFNQTLDRVSIKLLYILTPLLFFMIWLIFKSMHIKRKKKLFKPKNIKCFAGSTVLFILLIFIVYSIPRIIGYNVPWNFVYVWAPITFTGAIIIFLLLVASIYIYINFKNCSYGNA